MCESPAATWLTFVSGFPVAYPIYPFVIWSALRFRQRETTLVVALISTLNDDGSPSTYVEGILKFLQDYQTHFLATQRFCRRLSELGLLEPMSAQLGADRFPLDTL